MALGFLLILICQLIGAFCAAAFAIPVPGPVLGMVLFLGVLALLGRRRPGIRSGAERAGDLLLDHLQLLFVPAGVGLIAHVGVLREQWWPVLAGLVGAWLVALAVTGGTAALIRRLVPVGRGTLRGGSAR